MCFCTGIFDKLNHTTTAAGTIDTNIQWADTNTHLLSLLTVDCGKQRERFVGHLNLPSLRVTNVTVEKVDRRRADKVCDKGIGRVIINSLGCALLLYLSIAHHDNFVSHGHGLDLIVGDIDGGGIEPIVDTADFVTHLCT